MNKCMIREWETSGLECEESNVRDRVIVRVRRIASRRGENVSINFTLSSCKTNLGVSVHGIKVSSGAQMDRNEICK